MPSLWIVDADRLARTRLENLAAGGATIVSAAPGDARFVAAPPSGAIGTSLPRPDAVILGTSDLDAALQFAHEHAARMPSVRWLVVHEASLPGARVHELFDGLELTNLPWPSPPGPAGRAVSELLAPRSLPLSARRRRDALEARARRLYQDLDLAVLGQPATPPDRLLVRGEPGTGRLELLALLHERSRDGSSEEALLPVPCDETTGAEAIAQALLPFPPTTRVTVCLLEIDRLSETAQRAVRAWIEIGAAPVPGTGASLRWCATAGPAAGPWPGLLPELETSLGHTLVSLPPLRERNDLIEPFTVLHIAERCAERGIEPPVLELEALSQLVSHPWLGNLEELESKLDRALSNRRRPGGALSAADLGLGAATSPGHSAAGFGHGDLGDPHGLGDRDALPDAEDALEALGAAPLPEPELSAPDPESPGEPLTLIQVARPEADRTDEAPAAGGADRTDESHDAGSAEESLESLGAGPRLEQMGPPAGDTSDAAPEPLLTRLAGSMAHEVRNPLVTLRTFASLLPERYDDPEFRDDFREHVLQEVSRIDGLVDRLQEIANVGSPKLTPVDATGLLEGLLEESRPEIQARRLLVLQELDPTRPLAIADPDLLRLALSSLLHRALAWVPERADLFVASKHHTVGRGGGPTVQILLRFYSPDQTSTRPPGPARDALGLNATSLDVLFAEHLVQLQNGSLHFERGQPDETLVILDLPAV